MSCYLVGWLRSISPLACPHQGRANLRHVSLTDQLPLALMNKASKAFCFGKYTDFPAGSQGSLHPGVMPSWSYLVLELPGGVGWALESRRWVDWQKASVSLSTGLLCGRNGKPTLWLGVTSDGLPASSLGNLPCVMCWKFYVSAFAVQIYPGHKQYLLVRSTDVPEVLLCARHCTRSSEHTAPAH